MNKVIKKGLVIALALTMSLSTALPAFAADSTETAPVVVSATATAQSKARQYFTNYVSGNVSAAVVLQKVAAGEDICVVDIRDAVDYEKGHIAGAVNIPYGTAIASNLSKLPTDIPVYVYCYSGQTASQTIALMRMAGIEAYNISGGWNNGISKAEGIADLTSTKNATLNYGSHSVDSEVVAAVKEYYTLATKNGKFNISNSAAKDLIANDDVYLLDVRAENDHLKQWIAGVDKNIPFGEGMAKSFTSVLPKDKRILVQCYSGQTASQTVAVLRILATMRGTCPAVPTAGSAQTCQW